MMKLWYLLVLPESNMELILAQASVTGRDGGGCIIC